MTTSSISGFDLSFPTRREGFDTKSILDLVLDFWPQAVFQDAEEEGDRSVAEVLAEPANLASREFFVYEDRASAESWEKDGKTSDNSNRMLHFLVTEDPARPDALQVTMVLDDLTPELAELYASLSSLLEAGAGEDTRGRRRRSNLDAELRAAGSLLDRIQFTNLVEMTRRAFYPEWDQDELACHPHEALQFCELVRSRTQVPLPDSTIMRAMLNYRKRKAR